MLVVGDIHGKVEDYARVVRGKGPSVQVGDFGWGFLTQTEIERYESLQADEPDQHGFIRGNHDDPVQASAQQGFLHDGHYAPDEEILMIGGAWSIDHAYRVPGRSWWEDEECSAEAFDQFALSMQELKPRVMITHDSPQAVSYEMFIRGTGKRLYSTRTGRGLQNLFEIHQPEIWVFGHWHESRDETIEGTRFICLNELETFDLDLGQR